MVTHSEPGRGFVRLSLGFLVGIPIGAIVLAFWQGFVDTSPTLSEQERIRGWGTVVRELPATVLLVAFPLIGLALAVKGGRAGATQGALRAVWLHGAALFFALLITLNGSAENIMTSRPSTVKWLLLPAQIAISATAVMVARRSIGRTTNP